VKTLLVGGKVDLFRRGLGLTIGGWAKKCRVPESTMESVCLGTRDPSAKTLFCMIRYGGMNVAILELSDFGREGLV
jgi:hypothetical protein